MHDFLAHSEVFAIAATFVIYFLAQKLHKRVNYFFLNPVMISIVLIILFLNLFGLSYDSYNKGGHYIGFLLKPAVVALGVPLYLQLNQIKKQSRAILFSQLAGSLTGIFSVIIIAKLFNASRPVILSLIPKSVTTPIAMEISTSIGGIPALTAGVVITTGIFGAMLGLKLLSIMRIKDSSGVGLAMGTAAHGLGTAKAAEISDEHGAFGSLGLIINAIFTAIFAPWIVLLFHL